MYIVTAVPDLNECEVKITSPEDLTSACNINGTLPIYINFIPTSLVATWHTSFVVDSYPTEPLYVNSYQIGITQTDVITNVYRMNSCKHGYSETCLGKPPCIKTTYIIVLRLPLYNYNYTTKCSHVHNYHLVHVHCMYIVYV